jgi:hypothetical protein
MSALELEASIADWLRYAATRVSLRGVRAEPGLAAARKSGGETLLLGAYHRVNLGDLALGEAVSSRLRSAFAAGVIQNAIRYDGQERVIIGGGSLLTPDNIGRLRQAGIPAERVHAVGVDLWPRIREDWHRADIDYLARFAQVSLRSQANYKLAASADLVVPERLSWCHDNAFSLFEQVIAPRPMTGTVGINMMPHLFSLQHRRFKVGSRIAQKRFGDRAESAAQAYVALFRELVAQQVQAGRLVNHIPFTIDDDLFARTALAGLPVRFSPYSPSIRQMIDRLNKLELFVGTRYHAFVFALGLGVPFAGFAYAGKCENLGADVNMPNSSLLTDSDLAPNGAWQDRIAKLVDQPFVLPAADRQAIATRVCAHLDRILGATSGATTAEANR